MREEIVSFETARLAKEKGCPLESGWYYDLVREDHPKLKYGSKDCYGYQQFHNNLAVYAPTQALVQKWLRERESPIILEAAFGIIDDSESAYTWERRVYLPKGRDGSRKKDESDFWEYQSSFICNSGAWYSTYEEALEEGLQKALRLIK